MQNNPKEPQPPGRQRPLQKSMFLPDHYPPQAFIHPAQQQNINEFQQYNPLKRSLLDNPTMPPTSPQYQFRAQNNQSFTPTSYQQNTNIQGQFMAVQPRQGSHHQLLHHSTSLTTMKQASILMDRGPQGNNDSMTKNIARFQKQPGTEMKTITKSMPDAIQHQKIVADVVNLIKEKHLPTLVSIVKKELQDQLNTFKQEFNQFKQEFKNHLGKQEALNNELKNGLTRSPNGSSKLDKSPTPKHKQKDSQLSDLQKELFLLQNKLNKLEGSNKQNFNYFGEQLEKIWQRIKQKHKKQQKTAFKVSNIKSSLSAIMLEYKQIFAIKKQTNENQKRVSQQQILLSTCQYYVDRQGFLMDSENHYLVDHKGNQIRLQQKHIKLLQQHKILNR